MIITAENIVHYLTDKNFIGTASVVDGDFMVVDMTRRNRNFKILRKGDNGFFVKQVKNFDAQSISSLTREAQSYWLSQHDPGFKGIMELMPRLIHYDQPHNILVLELFPGSENLAEMHQRLGSFPVSIAASLGKSLGLYHKEVDVSKEQISTKKIFPATLPWMLTINPGYIAQVKNMDASHDQFFSIIEQYPEFLTSIEEIRNGWQINSLIHGDMKWDNCIVYKEELKIIDWELADLGDAAWDAGAIFQTYLSLWASHHTVQNPKYKIEEMQPAIAAFWKAYTISTTHDINTASVLLEKTVKCAAVRMIQTVYEQMHFTKTLDKNGILLLQLSLNILKKPAEAISALLGL